jgi:voltage-gated potassium channel Kch
MIATPLMHRLGEYIGNRLDPDDGSHDIKTSHLDTEQPYAIIAGFGRVGRRVATLLRKADLPYLAIEKDIDRVLKGAKAGYSVFYGNASHKGVLKAAGAADAAVLVCTLDNTSSAVRIVSIMNQHYPDIIIHARGYDSYHCDQLLKAGATTAISETLEESLQLGSTVLKTMDVFDEDIEALIELCRKEQCK